MLLKIKGDETWDKVQKFLAHEEGVNSIVWGPVIENEDRIVKLKNFLTIK